MRTPLAAALLALGAAGCASLQAVGLPAPSAPRVRPAEVAVASPPAASAPPSATPPSPDLPVAPPVPPLPPAPPAPAVARPAPPAASPPAPAPPPPAAPPAPPAPVAPAPQPPRVLAPLVSSEDEKRLQGDAQRRIDRTERLLRGVDQRRLADEQQQNLLTVQSFLVKAREALTEKDVQRATTLAEKAYLLAEELVRNLR